MYNHTALCMEHLKKWRPTKIENNSQVRPNKLKTDLPK